MEVILATIMSPFARDDVTLRPLNVTFRCQDVTFFASCHVAFRCLDVKPVSANVKSRPTNVKPEHYVSSLDAEQTNLR